MAASTPSRSRLRRLADLRPGAGRVLSIFVDLDPAEFGTPPARATQITSVLDEAGRHIDGRDDLDRDERVALREDVERVRGALDPQTMGSGGARSLAVFACGPAGLLEIVRLPYPLDTRFVVGETPFVDPLARAGEEERWCIALASRKAGRIFLGDRHGLEEVANVEDDVSGQHDQGGWSQGRFERSIEKEKTEHIDRVAEELRVLLRRRPFDRLLIGAPEPLDTEFEGRLHSYLTERLAGRVQIDVENTNADEVLAAAVPVIEEHAERAEAEAIERLKAGLGQPDGRAAAGLADVLAALNEQRVEVLLLERDAGARGWTDPETGYLSAEPGEGPTGNALVERDDVLEAAIEKAVEQSAAVLAIERRPDLGPHGGVAALLRF